MGKTRLFNGLKQMGPAIFSSFSAREVPVMLVGYARVSTSDQETRLQRDALKAAGVRTVYEEKASAVSKRPVLRAVLDKLKPGDVLVVWKLDRLARSLKDLLALLDTLTAKGCGFKSLTEPVDTSSPLGEFVLQILGAVAQFERRLIRERTIAGQVAFVQRGGVFGRPKALTELQERAVQRGLSSGQTKAELARRFGVTYIVIRRIEDEMNGRKNTGKLPVLRKYL